MIRQFEIGKIYPRFLKRLFVRAFTEGLKEPNKRVRENEWISALSNCENSLYYCSHCGIECFYDFEAENQGFQNACWRCHKQSTLPMRLYIDEQPMLLNHNTKIYAHDVGEIFQLHQKLLAKSHNIQRTNESGDCKTFPEKTGYSLWVILPKESDAWSLYTLTPRSKTNLEVEKER